MIFGIDDGSFFMFCQPHHVLDLPGVENFLAQFELKYGIQVFCLLNCSTSLKTFLFTF